MWHVSSRGGVATLRTAIHLLLTYLLLGLESSPVEAAYGRQADRQTVPMHCPSRRTRRRQITEIEAYYLPPELCP